MTTTFQRSILTPNQTHFSSSRSTSNSSRQYNKTRTSTFINGFNERFDVAFLAEDERRRKRNRSISTWISGARIDGNSGGIIASVLQTPQAIKQDLQNAASVTRDIVIQVSKDSAHFRWILIGSV